jgi:hypothetical protein
MPWRDIHLDKNTANMWASNGTAHIHVQTADINLTGWGSYVTVAYVNNSAFRPDSPQGIQAGTGNSYFPTFLGVYSDGNVKIGYAGGPTGNRSVLSVLTYDIG